MDPIDLRVDTTFSQALRCVEYRLPKPEGLMAPGFVLALGLRYGMIGMAASHHLLLTADPEEERNILAMMECWSNLVEDHVRWDMMHRLPFAGGSNVAHVVGRIAYLPLASYMPLYRRLYPLGAALELVSHAVLAENKSMIYEGWSWFKRGQAMRVFKANLQESVGFAMHFFERREADIEEVPEIVLIGE
jgi:hypothetical protein